MLVATLDVKAMLWKTSPAATELEEVTTDWLRQMLGLEAVDETDFGKMNDLGLPLGAVVEILKRRPAGRPNAE